MSSPSESQVGLSVEARQLSSRAEHAAQLKRFTPFENDIIIIDGLFGTGKSIIAPIVGAMSNVEKIKIEHIYEHVVVLAHLNKITSDTASWMLQTYADISQYNNVIGREINLRWADFSGPRNNPNSLRYFTRLFGGEGDAKVDELNKENIALNLACHMLMVVGDPVFEAYGNRAKVIEMVRHPLYMIDHWHAILSRAESSRVFDVSCEYRGSRLPWFALSWEDEYLEANLVDRVLIAIMRSYEQLDRSLQAAAARGDNVLSLTFESVVTGGNEPFDRIASFLGRKHHRRLRALMRKQQIPRKTISQGSGHPLYGWSSNAHLTEEQVYRRHVAFIEKNGSPENVEKFLALVEAYDRKHPSVLSQYRR